MAKAKKSESAPAPGEKKSAGGAKKPAGGKKSAAGGASQPPAIDTNLAASAAAAMILNRATGGTPTPGPAAPLPPVKKESAGFKLLKQNLTKPASPGGLLSNTGTQKKSGNLPFGGGKQKGHNQTFGADVNRAGVPRRTGGG